MGKGPKSDKKAQKTKVTPKAKEVKDVPSQASVLECGPVTIAKKQITEALNALKAYTAKKAEEEQMLFDGESETVCVKFAVSKILENRNKHAKRIQLPHALWNDESEVCLITKPPQRKYKDILEESPIPAIKKVIDVEKWKKRYAHHHERRQVRDQFELFLCDKNLDHAMPGLLGKEFFKKSKMPTPVKAGPSVIVQNIKEALGSVYYTLPRGPGFTVAIGRACWDAEKLAENCSAVIEAVLKDLQSSDSGVVSMTIQATNSPSLQIYSAAAPERLVPTISAEEKKAKKETREKIQQAKKDVREAAAKKGHKTRAEFRKVLKRTKAPKSKTETKAAVAAPASDDESAPVKAAKPARVKVIEAPKAKDTKKSAKGTKKVKKDKAVKKDKKVKA